MYPMFIREAPEMVRLLEQHGVVVYARVDDAEMELWLWLRRRIENFTSDCRESTAHYGASLAAAKKNRAYMPAWRWAYTVYGMESGLLKARLMTH